MRISRIFFAGFIALALSAGVVLGNAAAQDATAVATPAVPWGGYPVAIHQGTCTDPVAQPAWQLENAQPPGTRDSDDQPTIIGPSDGSVVSETSITIDFEMDDLANDGHVVAVHASPDEFGTIVACGQIAGIKHDGQLFVALNPVGNSGVGGFAIVYEDESGFWELGDDELRVTVYVFDANVIDDVAP